MMADQLIALGLLPEKYRISLDWLLGELVAKPEEGKSVKIILLNYRRRFCGDYYFASVDLLGGRYSHQVERILVICG